MTRRPRQGPEDLAHVFFALGDDTRLRLISMLCAGGAFSTTELTMTTEISRQAVTKHLQVLASAGLVRNLRVGRERLWQLDEEHIDQARRTLDTIGQQWQQALVHLEHAQPRS